jgi:surface protein
MFDSALSFDQDISGWDVSAVTGLNRMFYNATVFNQPLNSWDVSAVTDMGGMFASATAFDQDISTWDVSAVTNMKSMFDSALSFDQDISGWDVSAVTGMSGFMEGKSTANYNYYDNLLNAWSLLTLQNEVTWDMGLIEYTSAGATARASIISAYDWSIYDGGLI